MQRQRLTTIDKLKYITRGIEQKCRTHQKDTKYYCSKIDCKQYTFMCQRCYRQNTHEHIDQIQDYEKWTDKIVQKINEAQINSNPLFQTQHRKNKSKAQFQTFLNELKRVYGVIESLEAKIAEVIIESKQKIMGYIRKYEYYGQSRLSQKIKLYTNPYLLINKINSQRNDNFVQQLKQSLRGQTVEMLDPFNPKYQLITLQNKIKGIASGNNNQIFNLPKQVARNPQILQAQKNSIMCEGRPDNFFSREDTILVSVNNETHIYNSRTQKIHEKVAISISQCSSQIIDSVHSFIGIASTNNKQLLSYINKVPGNFAFEFKIYCALLYQSKGKFYAFLGRDEGKITIFDLQKNAITATLQQYHNSRVEFIRFWEDGNRIFSSGRSTPISKYLVAEQKDEVILQYEEQIPSNVSEIQELMIHGCYIIILTKGRNFYIYDMLLKLQFRTSYRDTCKDFDMGSVLADTDNNLVIASHNIGQSELHICTVDKQKPEHIVLQKMSFFPNQQIRYLQLNGSDVWFVRTDENAQKVYNYNLIIA